MTRFIGIGERAAGLKPPRDRKQNTLQGVPADSRADWYRDAIIYEVRVRSFHDANGDGIGDFPGLTEKLGYLQELGVDTLWLLPFYPSPLRDDGYDISHYTEVHPDMGTLADFRNFLKEAHGRGLRVITELVLNHTSDAHEWFQRSRKAKPGSPERNFYVWSDTADKYAEARIIFKDFERSNWTWDPVAGAYFWHRFYGNQPDLNFENPEVRLALLQVVDFWMDLGVDGLRLDAVPYLFEREGTNCENLPETFGFLRELRRHVDASYPNRMLLAEANQWPEDAVRYLDGGDTCQMAFHFPVMPRMYLALHMEDRFPIVDILSQTPALPANCQWAFFLRNHDELTLEMVTEEERDYLYEAYAKEPNMRLNLGIRRRLAPLVENSRRKLELLNCLLFSMPGTPVLYYGDEIGMGDNTHLADRNGVRTPMQWSPDRNAGFSKANPQRLYLPVIVDPEYNYETVNVETQQRNPTSLLWWNKRLIALRKRFRAFGRGTFELLQPDNHRILAFLREHGEERILVVMNLSRFAQYTELDLSRFENRVPVELFGNTAFPPIKGNRYPLTPGPHMVLWFSLVNPPSTGPGASVPVPVSYPMFDMDFGKDFPERNAGELEHILAGYLPGCRWFGGKAMGLKETRIGKSLRLRVGFLDFHLLLVRCIYEDGSDESYFLPVAALESDAAIKVIADFPSAIIARIPGSKTADGREGYLADAMAVPEFCSALFQRIQGKERPARNLVDASLRGVRMKGFAEAVGSDSFSVRIPGLQQTNTSIVFGEKYILKVYRRPEAGINPDLEVNRFLTESPGPVLAPKVLGWLEFKLADGTWATLGLLQEFIPDARDAWTHARDEIYKFFDRALAEYGSQDIRLTQVESAANPLDCVVPEAVRGLAGGFLSTAELLGRRTAEMHLALGRDTQDPRFSHESYGTLYQRSIYQSMRNTALKTLRLLRQRLPHLTPEIRTQAQELLASEKQVMAILEEFRKTPITSSRMRHHGDFHLGQLLFTGKDFQILDFEGEPARPLADRVRKRSPLRDVAGMIRSFHYASLSALYQQSDSGVVRSMDRERLEVWGRRWYRWVSAVYLRAYLKAAEGAHFLPKEAKEVRLLIRVFLLEKALYEVAYELNHRPEWTGIPLRCIGELIQDRVQP
jgi:maltose alpha-D-glucosyltransferase / alpha-amylase